MKEGAKGDRVPLPPLLESCLFLDMKFLKNVYTVQNNVKYTHLPASLGEFGPPLAKPLKGAPSPHSSTP